jgi:hypothetical protein
MRSELYDHEIAANINVIYELLKVRPSQTFADWLGLTGAMV